MPIAETLVDKAFYIIIFWVTFIGILPFLLKREVIIGLSSRELLVVVTMITVVTSIVTYLLVRQIRTRGKPVGK